MSRGLAWPIAGVVAALGFAAAAGAQEIVAHSEIQPQVVRLGERAVYRGTVVVPPAAKVRWLPPDSSQTLSWGERRAWRKSGHSGSVDHRRSEDTVAVEVGVQAFELDRVIVPGLSVEIGQGAGMVVQRLPDVALVVMPVMTAADSQATLREVHGPLAAPWWERVPWVLVIAGLLALTAVVLLVRWLRRRRPAPAVTVPARAQSPAERALAALAELRARRLPEQNRLPEHAFHLGQILRRYLEVTIGTPLPGDTTGELVHRLEQAGLGTEDVRRLAALMRGWDQIKFARQPATRDEALRTETAVEAYVRRGTGSAVPSPQREVA